MVEAGSVVDDGLILVRRQHVPGPSLQKMDSSLIHCQPEVFRPVGCKGLLERIK